ncbi:MAG TPA: S8 family serine peptidase, partial [Methylomirabilota bacterium]|nr:S8 family serine peptidase [Methylomirabilota bacterium]
MAAQRQTIAATQAFVRSRLTGVQHRVARQPSGLPFLAVELDADGLRALEAQRGVVKLVEEDKLERPGLFQSVPQVGGADAFMRHGVTGSGQAVAILDTGVDKNHNFFGGRVVREACFSTNLPPFPITSVCPGGLETVIGNNAGLNCPPFVAGCDHGTHVAGIAAGGSPGVSGSGVAPGAKIIAIQVFSRIDDAGFCAPDPSPCVAAFSSDIIEALNHVFSIRNQLAPDVIAAVNMSLGGTATAASCPLDSRKPAIDQLRAAGIATFIASGNEFKTGAISPPACIPTAISVGAVTKQDVVADYSNSASTLGLLAPGGAGAQFGVPEDDILSSVPGNQFDFKAGTSMASPHAAGAFALMREAHPTASIDVLVGAMKAAGVPVIDTRPGASNRVKPRIDVGAAIDAAKGDLVTTVLTGPTNIAAGATYTLKFSVKNTGPTPVDPSLLGLFISPDNTITLADVALGSTPVPALNPGVTFSGSVAVTVPSNTTLGPTFFGAIANVDGAADEATQANNSRASAAAVVVLPDYSVLSVLSSLLAAAPGSNVTVTHTVKNVAAAPNTGPASVSELFVSTDNALDGTDVSLGTVPVPALIAGGASAPKRIVQAPTQVGLYWIFARANTGNTIIEASTANNVRATSKPLIVGPDLLPTAAPLTPTAKVPGSVFGVATSVKNQGGAAAAGPFNVTVYLSTDATFDGGDVAIGTRVVNTLAPGATSLGTVMVTILPSQAQGAYFLLVRADAGGVVPEADETNNVKASAKAFIVGTDLLPTAAPLAPTAKAPGGPAFSVSTTVKNQGGAAAGPFDVNVYLSTDATFDGADTLVGTRRVAGG